MSQQTQTPAIIRPIWEGFERTATTKHAGQEQRAEMRRAFYGGVLAMLGIIDNLGDSDDPEVIAGGLLSIHLEINQFVDGFGRGT